MSIALKYGGSFIEFTKESTYRSMIAHQHEETKRILKNLGTPEGVQRVRIYDHKGEILFCSHEISLSTSIDKASVACTGCHTEPEKSSALLTTPKNWAVYKNEEGSTSLKLISQISNEQGCYTATCHAHPKEQEILGFIEADLSLALLDEAMFKQGLALTAYVIVFVMAVSLFLGIINYNIVTKPVNKLVSRNVNVAVPCGSLAGLITFNVHPSFSIFFLAVSNSS